MALLQTEIDRKNSEFWSELCGSTAAQRLKITDSSIESIKKFDDWFFSFYPYLKKNYLNIEKIQQKTILEIGLGYGTVSQFLAKNSNVFFGADIAEGPVNFVNHRLKLIGKLPSARVMSAHKLEFEDNLFDHIVSIGCFHHTGNIKKCIDEAYRVLKPGGELLFMCYSKYSLREFLLRPIKTLFSFTKESRLIQENDWFSYDHNTQGQAAPFTEVFGKKGLARLCKKFSSYTICTENSIGIRTWLWPRKLLINNLGKVMGTDLYVKCIK